MSDIIIEIANTEDLKEKISEILYNETYGNYDGGVEGRDEAADEIVNLFLRLLGVEDGG